MDAFELQYDFFDGQKRGEQMDCLTHVDSSYTADVMLP